MSMTVQQQKLPGAGPEREALREKGQFWTPAWIAEAMVEYAVSGGSDHIFDPAVGAGAFFRAAKVIASTIGRHLKLLGTEFYPDALRQAHGSGLSERDLANVQITDFVLNPPQGPFKAIVANPPYIRHHRLPMHVKAELKALSARLIGNTLDGRAGLHVYFLIRALQLLDKDGRLAFIMPADTCEGVFAPTLWNWIAAKFRLEAVITFAPDASPFPTVDTNPIIFMIRNAPPVETLHWVRCHNGDAQQLTAWTSSGFKKTVNSSLSVYSRQLSEALTTGLSRTPVENIISGPTLGDCAKVLRGIATGANEFFFLTRKQAAALRIPDTFLVPAIGRTRDILGEEISTADLDKLEALNRPTLLFSPDGRSIESFPKEVREYLHYGEQLDLPARPLIAMRRPWYKMETRNAPLFLFAYLGRRNARFIYNRAGVVPLTGFLCVYPRRHDPAFIKKLWVVLQHSDTVANLTLVGKSYGQGAVKVEPRALEKLPLPESALSQAGMKIEGVATPLPFS